MADSVTFSSPMPFLTAQMRAVAEGGEKYVPAMVEQARAFLGDARSGHERNRYASELAYTLAEILEHCRDSKTINLIMKALLSLGQAGEVAVHARVIEASSSPEEVLRRLDMLLFRDQLLLLNRFFMMPRPVEPGIHDAAAERVREIAGQDPEEVLLFLERLADEGRTPAYPVQWVLLKGQFAVWLEALLKLDLGRDQTMYMAKTVGLLHWPDIAEELCRLAGEDAESAILAVRAAVRSAAVNGKRAEAAIKDFLKHPEPAVRREAVSALVEIGSGISVRALSLFMKQGPEERTALLSPVLSLWNEDFKAFLSATPENLRAEIFRMLAGLVAEHDASALGRFVSEKAGDIPDLNIKLDKLTAGAAEPVPDYTPPQFTRQKPESEAQADQEGLFGKVGRMVRDLTGKEMATGPDEARLLREIENGDELRKALVRNADLAWIELKNNTFTETLFSTLGLGSASIQRCTFTSCRFAGVDFRGAEIVSSEFTGCIFEHCIFADSAIRSASFSHCSFQGCYFGSAIFENPALSGCSFSVCDFWGARISDAEIESCAFRSANFQSASLADAVLKGVDWLDCVFDKTFFARCGMSGGTCSAGIFRECVFNAVTFDDPAFLLAEDESLKSRLRIDQRTPESAPESLGENELAALRGMLESWSFERDAARRAGKMLAQNRRRMLWAESKWGDKTAEFVRLLPMLLEGRLSVPGGSASAPNCRFPGYSPDPGTLDLVVKYAGGAEGIIEPAAKCSEFEGLYSIGSIGTIAQTKMSDLDLWLCYESGALGREQIESLRALIAEIEDWAQREFGLEVHFFVMDTRSVRENDFGFSDTESAGSSQAKLLKEEFYRTMIILAGNIPAWCCVPAGTSAQDYDAALDRLARSPWFKGRLVDLGYLDAVDKKEFFGASLWQIVKALKRPFKSVMKFAVLDRYFASEESGLLFCDGIKSELARGSRDLWDVDAYAVLFREVFEFYERAGNAEAMDLMRRAFLQKTRFNIRGDDASSASETSGVECLEYFYPVSDSPMEHGLTPRAGMFGRDKERLDFAENVRTGLLIGKFMFNTYEQVRDKLWAENLDARVSREDMTKLGRKILAGFMHKPGKIMLVPFVDSPRGVYSTLDIQSLGKPGAKGAAWVVRGLRRDSGRAAKSVFEEIVRDDHPVRLAAWLTANEIYDPEAHVQSGTLQSPVGLSDLIDLMRALHVFFPHAETFDTDIEEALNDERAVRAFIVVNMMSLREETEVRDAQVIYSTNWGEMFCLTEPRELHLLGGDPMDFVRANAPNLLGREIKVEFHIPHKARIPKILP